MKNISWRAMLLCTAFFSASHGAYAGDANIVFSPAAGVSARLQVRDQQVKLFVAGPQDETTATIVVETGQRLKVEVEDYNFDGHKDFAISHGDGMGTYWMYQVYV